MRVRLKSYVDATSFVERIPVASIIPSKFPLREDEGNLEELASSIKSKGLLEPIVVRPKGNKFEIVAGHRRFRACRMNRFVEVPAIVLDLKDKEAFEVSLEENIQRKSLDPIEEARAFSIYVNKYGYGSITELANRIGKSEEYVSHRILLLKLPVAIQALVSRRLLTASNGWELTRVKDERKQAELAQAAMDEDLTVRELRAAAKARPTEPDFTPSVSNEPVTGEGIPTLEPSSSPEKSSRAKKAASSVLRIAMIRIGSLVDSLGEEDQETKEELLQLRLKVHSLLDTCSRREIEEEDGLESEITRIIRGIFLDNLNSGDLSRFAKLRSKNYTAFGDFPPYSLRDLRQSIVRDARIAKTLHHSNCAIDDLRITRFTGGALATFVFSYDMEVGDMQVNMKSRVSYVFEKTSKGWALMHEHWSSGGYYDKALGKIEKQLTKYKVVPIP